MSMKEDVARLAASGEKSVVFGTIGKAVEEERRFLAENSNRELVKVTRTGLNEKGERVQWTQYKDAESQESVAEFNEGYSCPPLPDWVCGN